MSGSPLGWDVLIDREEGLWLWRGVCCAVKIPGWDCDVNGTNPSGLSLAFGSWNLLEGSCSVLGLRELGHRRPHSVSALTPGPARVPVAGTVYVSGAQPSAMMALHGEECVCVRVTQQ